MIEQKPRAPQANLQYVRDEAGQFYLEVPQVDGTIDYQLAEPGLSFQSLPGGKWIAVRDFAEYQRQRAADSHMAYVKTLSNDPAEVRRTSMRQEKVKRHLEQLVIDRVTPHQGPNVEIVKDEKALDLLEMYRKAFAEGRAKDCPFRPLSTYEHKLKLRDGSVIRPLFKGEVGMYVRSERESTIVCLENGYGQGAQIQVTARIGGGPR